MTLRDFFSEVKKTNKKRNAHKIRHNSIIRPLKMKISNNLKDFICPSTLKGTYLKKDKSSFY